MPQTSPQATPTTKPHPNAGRRFGVPISGHQGKLAVIAAREAKIRAKAEQIAEGLGAKLDRMSGLDRDYLLRAAELLTRRARTAEDLTRLSNSAHKLIASVERRHGRNEAHGADFSTLLPDGAP